MGGRVGGDRTSVEPSRLRFSRPQPGGQPIRVRDPDYARGPEAGSP